MIAKAEGFEGELSFEEGDVVLAKCVESFPEPATVVCFRGFDVDKCEIYKIKFVVGGSWAYLQSYCMRYLTLNNIKELR